MGSDYGQKVGTALKAVRQLHSDTSRLLVGCDGVFEGDPVFGSSVTRDLSYQVQTSMWMAEGVFRLYRDPKKPEVVRGVTVCFIDGENLDRLSEPVLVMGRIHYLMTEKGPAKCEPWDLWDFHLGEEPDAGRISARWFQACPLYSVGSLTDIERMLGELDAKAGESST